MSAPVQVWRPTRTFWATVTARNAAILDFEDFWSLRVHVTALDPDTAAAEVLTDVVITRCDGLGSLPEIEARLTLLGYTVSSPWERMEQGFRCWIELAEDWARPLVSAPRHRA